MRQLIHSYFETGGWQSEQPLAQPYEAVQALLDCAAKERDSDEQLSVVLASNARDPKQITHEGALSQAATDAITDFPYASMQKRRFGSMTLQTIGLVHDESLKPVSEITGSLNRLILCIEPAIDSSGTAVAMVYGPEKAAPEARELTHTVKAVIVPPHLAAAFDHALDELDTVADDEPVQQTWINGLAKTVTTEQVLSRLDTDRLRYDKESEPFTIDEILREMAKKFNDDISLTVSDRAEEISKSQGLNSKVVRDLLLASPDIKDIFAHAWHTLFPHKQTRLKDGHEVEGVTLMPKEFITVTLPRIYGEAVIPVAVCEDNDYMQVIVESAGFVVNAARSPFKGLYYMGGEV